MIAEMSIYGLQFSRMLSVATIFALLGILLFKYKANFKVYIMGALACFLGGMLIPNIIVKTLSFSGVFKSSIMVIVISAIIMGIFQESSKFIWIKKWVKLDGIKDIITFGAGFSAVQALSIAMTCSADLSTIQSINNGTFAEKYAGVPELLINQLQEIYVNTPDINWWMMGVEALLYVIFHIAMTMFIVKAVKEKKNKYFFIAIGLDILVLIFTTMKFLNTTAYIIKGIMYALIGVAAIIYIIKEVGFSKPNK